MSPVPAATHDIWFHAERNRHPAVREVVIEPIINGVTLSRLIAQFEGATVAGHGGVPLSALAGTDPGRFGTVPIAGAGDFPEYDTGLALLLVCSCYCAGCDNVVAEPVVDDSLVEWRDLRRYRADGPFKGLGPFRFKRTEYEVALTDLQRRLGGLKPRR